MSRSTRRTRPPGTASGDGPEAAVTAAGPHRHRTSPRVEPARPPNEDTRARHVRKQP